MIYFLVFKRADVWSNLTSSHTDVLGVRVQSAIASTPQAAWQGYLLGGIMWFCIPFTLATTMGLAALAADLPITLEEAGSGKRLVSLSGLCASQYDGDAAERSRLCGTALG